MITLLKFSATWCGPCKILSKTLEKVLKDFPQITVQEVDVEANNALVRRHSITSIPVLVLNGRQLKGNVQESSLRKWLMEALNV